MTKFIRTFLSDTAGAAAVEHALIVAGISAAIMTIAIRLLFR